MGEVYRARDTRLERDVAIKILPRHLASLPELSQRFEREVRAVSSLIHPYICILHDAGHQDGTHFLMMEYLEGETLASVWKKARSRLLNSCASQLRLPMLSFERSLKHSIINEHSLASFSLRCRASGDGELLVFRSYANFRA